jgi:hypothetical protein
MGSNKSSQKGRGGFPLFYISSKILEVGLIIHDH